MQYQHQTSLKLIAHQITQNIVQQHTRDGYSNTKDLRLEKWKAHPDHIGCHQNNQQKQGVNLEKQ